MWIVLDASKHVNNSMEYFVDKFIRLRLPEPAQATEECPHQYGYYLMGDSRNCGQFKNCAAGRAFIFDCPEGLAFNAETYRCDWPDQVASCDAEGKFLQISLIFINLPLNYLQPIWVSHVHHLPEVSDRKSIVISVRQMTVNVISCV